MKVIYTTEDISIDGVEVRGIGLLHPLARRWVKETRRSLLAKATLPESVTASMLSKCDEKPIRQAYFKIRGRSYFLDFFFPKSMVAVEIDGSVHKFRKAKDKRRDADFRSIGIRTIRIKNKDVMEGKLYDILFKKLFK